MTVSNKLKGLLACMATLAFAGTALAQGNPPNPAVKSAPVGAGQQSSQQTPMGTTGTPAGGSTAAGSSGTSGTAATTGSTNTGSTTAGSTGTGSTGSGSSMGSASTSADTSAPTEKNKRVRVARADRN